MGDRKYGETYVQAADATGFEPDYLAILKYVGATVEPSRRKESLSFSHHRLVASLSPAEQERLLSQAEQNGWTRNELAAAIRDFKAETLLEYHPRKSDTVTDLTALPEPIDFAKLKKLSKAYEQIEQWNRERAEKFAVLYQEDQVLAAELAELRSININELSLPELKRLVDRATALINRAHVMEICALRELGKLLNSIPQEQHKDFFALANLPAAVRDKLIAERVAELL